MINKLFNCFSLLIINFDYSFLFENYLNYFDDIEDVMHVASDFEITNNYNNKIWNSNEILAEENKAYASFLLGFSLLANNYHAKNIQKKFSSILGPKLFSYEKQKKAKKESLRILVKN